MPVLDTLECRREVTIRSIRQPTNFIHRAQFHSGSFIDSIPGAPSLDSCGGAALEG
jgi:hypothetical protein